jgi:hypothetical protein
MGLAAQCLQVTRHVQIVGLGIAAAPMVIVEAGMNSAWGMPATPGSVHRC